MQELPKVNPQALATAPQRLLWERSKQLWHSTLLVLLLCCSCVQDVNLEKHREQKVVVNCLLTADSTQTLSLTYSNPLNQFYYDEVETATASLFLNGEKVGDFKKTAYAKWTIKHFPKTNGNYRLVVNIPQHNTLEATTTMPEVLRIEKAEGDTRSPSATSRKAMLRLPTGCL